MKLSILYVNLLALLGTIYCVCILDTKKGWRLDCGLRDSYLLRVKDFGGFKANFDFGFGVGDEKGFPNSITKSNKAKQINPYAHKHTKYREPESHSKPSYEKPSYEKPSYEKPSYSHKPTLAASHQFHPQVSNYQPVSTYSNPLQPNYFTPADAKPFYISQQPETQVSDHYISTEDEHNSHSKPHSVGEHIFLHNSPTPSQPGHEHAQHAFSPPQLELEHQFQPVHNHITEQFDPSEHQLHEHVQPLEQQPVTSSYSELRRNGNMEFSRRHDFPYQFHMPQHRIKPKKKKKKRMWPFSLFSWGKDEEEEEEDIRSNYVQNPNSLRRQFVQTPFIGEAQLMPHSQFGGQRQFVPQHQFAAQPQFFRGHSAAQLQQHAALRQQVAHQQQAALRQQLAFRQQAAIRQQAFIHPSSNSIFPQQQQFANPFGQGFHRNQRPFVFRSPNIQSTTKRPATVGPELGTLLNVGPRTEADSDSVPSFAAKMFVVREAPKEFFPPKYRSKNSPNEHISVQIPRTNFYCEEQSYLPGIYADTQLGCKMFHLCVPSAIGSSLTSYLCPNSTLFDQSILQCNYWYNVDCESSSRDFNSNLALAKSYRKINAAHLDLHGATDIMSLSLLSQNINNLGGVHATNRRGRVLDADPSNKLSSRIDYILELIDSNNLEQTKLKE